MHYALFISSILLTFIVNSRANFLSSIKNPLNSLFRKRYLLNAYATKSGTTPLLVQAPYIVAFVDFTNYADETSNFMYDSTNSQPMQLALYTSTTLLTTSSGCFNYTPFDCSTYNCTKDANDPATVSINFPHFNATGTLGTTSVFLDYSYFSLSSESLFASSCSNQNSSFNGSGIYGIIGMGTNGFAVNNFKGYRPIFSVHIPSDSDDATLSFRTDLSYAESNTPTAQIESDGNWHILGVNNIEMGSYSYNVTQNLIFDMNAETLGFPLETYNDIMIDLQDLLEITCTNDTHEPTCTYEGNIPSFPTLTIQIGNQSIPIPQEAYIGGWEGNNVTLLLRGLDPSLDNDSYVNPIYKNYIILGSNVMTYYYTIFDGTSGNKITLYVANQSDDIMLLYVVLACGGVLFVSCALCCFIACCIRTIKEKTPEKNQVALELETDNKQAVKQDLMFESGTIGANSTYDSIDSKRKGVRTESQDYSGPSGINSFSEERDELDDSGNIGRKMVFSGGAGQFLDRKQSEPPNQEMQVVKKDKK